MCDYVNTDASQDSANGLPTLAKGDLITGSVSGVTILPVSGIDGYVLKSDSSSPTGLAWLPDGIPSTILDVDQIRFNSSSPSVRLIRGSTTDSILLSTITNVPGKLELGRLTSPAANDLEISSSTGTVNMLNNTLANVDVLRVNTIAGNAAPVIINPGGFFPVNFVNNNLINIAQATMTTLSTTAITSAGAINVASPSVIFDNSIITPGIIGPTGIPLTYNSGNGIHDFSGEDIVDINNVQAAFVTTDEITSTGTLIMSSPNVDLTGILSVPSEIRTPIIRSPPLTGITHFATTGIHTFTNVSGTANRTVSLNLTGTPTIRSADSGFTIDSFDPLTLISGLDIVLNAGANINCSLRPLINVGGINTTDARIGIAANDLGTVVRIGVQTDTPFSTDNPNQINMGTGVCPLGGGVSIPNQKLLIYARDNGHFAGFTFTNDGYFVSAMNGISAFQWRWANPGGSRMILDYVGNLSTTASITTPIVIGTTRVTTPTVTTSSGNLVLNPAGTSVDLSNKSIINSGSVSATSVITPSITTSSGNLTINPSGLSVSFSSKTINNINLIQCIDSITLLGGPKLRLHSGDGVNPFGIGVTSTTMNYEGSSGGSHNFYIGGNPIMSVTGDNVVMRRAITTNAGDLSLNPVGANVDFNGKNIINANIPAITRTVISTTQNLATDWTSGGVLTIETAIVGSNINFRIRGTATCSNTTSVYTSNVAIPVAARLATNREYNGVFLAFGLGAIVVRIASSGLFEIFRLDSTSFTPGQVLNFGQVCCYGSYFTDA